MEFKEVLTFLETHGDDKLKKPYKRYGFETLYGLRISGLRSLASSIGFNQKLAKELAMIDAFETLFLSVLLEDSKVISKERITELALKAKKSPVVDQALADVIIHSHHIDLLYAWYNHPDDCLRYASYATLSSYFRLLPLEKIDVSFGHLLLEQIKHTLLLEDIHVQNAMNNVVVMAGLHVPELVEHAYEIAQHIGYVMPLKAKNSCNIQSATDYLDRYLQEPKYSRVAKLNAQKK